MPHGSQTPTASATRFLDRAGRLSYVEDCHWHVTEELLSAFRTIEMLEQRLTQANQEITSLQRDLRTTRRA